MKFNGNPAKLYRGFRLNVTENNGADRFQLLKWQLFGSETAGVDNVAADLNASEISAVYNLQGVEVAKTTEGLKGLYIVRTGKGAKKVIL